MNAALGTAGVVLGFVSAVLGTITVGYGLLRGRDTLLRLARPYSLLVLGGAILAFAAMERALIQRDFTVLYVAEHGSSRTPPLFNIATLWAALEGSILLWALILGGYIAITVHRFRNRLSDPLVGWASLVMLGVAVFFFGLLMGPANPFTSFDPPIGYDGPGPDPLLQNHILMAVHPPMLYLGYVGFTVPFAFAVAALVTGRVGEGWLVETRRWTLVAWGFLTSGIILGAWWSYEVLGWGGYWGWDPVENASFLPWLTGTAYLHSVMVQERRGMLRVWNLSLLCATFSLTILGTFLTRSGVLESVHAFADGAVGNWLIAFFALIVIGSVGLIGWRGDRLRAPGRIDSPISREGAFLANNVLFAAFAFIVLLGTVFPLFVEAIDDRRITVGAPYFERMTMPVGFVLLFLMAIAPVLPWRKASGEVLADRLHWPAWAGVGAIAVAVAFGARGFAPLLAFGLGGFAGGAAVRQIVLATRRQGLRGFVGRTNGGMIVHLGVVLIAVGFAASSSYITDVEVSLEPGESTTVDGHEITFVSSETIEQDEKISQIATVTVDGTVRAPGVERYITSGRVIFTPSVLTTPVRDIFLTLPAEPNEDGSAVIRVIIQPLVVWIWTGGIIMAIGTVLSLFPGRRRRPTDPTSAPLADTPARRDGPESATNGAEANGGVTAGEPVAGEPAEVS
ncbi:MAG: heme lyase CcmF/NrfE family subunit [Actinomycetota bacterium]|nr:heme lyase CcmF/NrfE family subunit [Actinomycetota bacterium]